MGGRGSGRYGYCISSRQTTEDCRRLDVNRLNKAGALIDGFAGGWEWTRNGERVANIGFTAETARLILHYRYRYDGGKWEDVREPIAIDWTPCRFGGVRPWFKCPGVVNGQPCRRRVAHLYAGGSYFLCRHCYRLHYASQSEKPLDRLARRSRKLRDRIGGLDFGVLDLPPFRPKGMHWDYYHRQCEQIDVIDRQIERQISGWM